MGESGRLEDGAAGGQRAGSEERGCVALACRGGSCELLELRELCALVCFAVCVDRVMVRVVLVHQSAQRSRGAAGPLFPVSASPITGAARRTLRVGMEPQQNAHPSLYCMVAGVPCCAVPWEAQVGVESRRPIKSEGRFAANGTVGQTTLRGGRRGTRCKRAKKHLRAYQRHRPLHHCAVRS